MPSQLHTHIDRSILLLDGAMGTALQGIDLDVDRDYLGRENCVDVLVRSRPELIESIHDSFLAAGSDAVETNTFGANPLVFGEFDEELVSWSRAINCEAATIARRACERHHTSERPRFVLGSMGPGTKLITLGHVSWDRMLASYTEQARGLLDGAVDGFLIETCQDLLQVKCAINACLAALEEAGRSVDDTPIMVSLTIEANGTMLLGAEIAAAVTTLAPYPIASLGLNCATGPVEMAEHLRYLSQQWDRPISVVPNAGLPVLHEGNAVFPLKPKPMSETLRTYIEDLGVRIIGGCCGTTPEHIAELRGVIDSVVAGDHSSVQVETGCSSGYAHVDYEQENSFLIVGERMNASGSRKFRQLLEEEQWDAIVDLARDQVRNGANVLDINVDYAGRDNAEDMATIVQRVVGSVAVPLMIDSTQLSTIEAGLKHAPGKSIINSGNFEDGEEKFDAICSLATTYGAAIVIGSIDEDEESAMARTKDRKVSIARRAFVRATEHHGIAPCDVIFDPLVLPISTGMDADRRSGVELVEAVAELSKILPECQITCGLSNCSFGLKPAARKVLNSVFLQELLESGLTSAIVHAGGIVPLARIPEEHVARALDVIYDRRTDDHDPLAVYIELFQDVKIISTDAEVADRSLAEWLQWHIVEGVRDGLEDRLNAAMQEWRPVDVINDHLLAGMKTVGVLFGSGQMQLPFVLQSAEVMKRAVAFIEPHLDVDEGDTKGTIVLATVKGDVHDIGKNLVDIILSNNGWTVHNLGIKQPIAKILDAWTETKADVIGMSGLLVKSVMVMEENLKVLNDLPDPPAVILGGAALSRYYCESHLRSVYNGNVYYGRDAFDGLRIANILAAGDAADEEALIEERLAKRAAVEAQVSRSRSKTRKGSSGGDTATVFAPTRLETVAAPEAPFLGSRVVESVPLSEVLPFVNEVALFRGQWGFKKGERTAAEYEEYVANDVRPILKRLSTWAQEEAVLQPKVVYGFFECVSDGDELVIFDPTDGSNELERFAFPRQTKGNGRSICDYFAPADSGRRDVVGFHCVTVGTNVSEVARRLFEENEYQEYLFVHGLGVECAEALAELWHKRMRAELSIGTEDSPRIRELFQQKYRGCRYSFGYPACPDMSLQEKLFRLIEPERIGCRLTENWQIDPEQSTSALIVHHPAARYFTV